MCRVVERVLGTLFEDMVVVEYVEQICTRKILYFADADMLV